MSKFVYRPQGVCSSEFRFDIEDNIIKSLQIIGGCPGNTLGVSRLVTGKTVDETIETLSGIRCGFKATSCPDQVARALTAYKNANTAQ